MPDARFACHYSHLLAGQWPARDARAAFDNHVLACMLAAGLAESERTGLPLTEAVGLAPRDLFALLTAHFPLVSLSPLFLDSLSLPSRDTEEELLHDLLSDHRAGPTRIATWLAAIIARRALREDHLWQDLGFFSRDELNRMLATHFPGLHAGNVKNMRWKKYFYRCLCEREGFSLCTAPSCTVCCDFDACFGPEDGMSQLAVARRVLDTRPLAEAAE